MLKWLKLRGRGGCTKLKFVYFPKANSRHKTKVEFVGQSEISESLHKQEAIFLPYTQNTTVSGILLEKENPPESQNNIQMNQFVKI